MKRYQLPGLLLGVTDGSPLERRVLKLLHRQALWTETGRRIAAIVCVGAIGLGTLATAMLSVQTVVAQRSQNAVDVPAFDTVSIKPASPDALGTHIGISDGNFMAVNYTLSDIIRWAYELNAGNDQLVGGPEWMKTAKFDINTKEDAAALAQLSKMHGPSWMSAHLDQVKLILADRFKLKVHLETRELPVYELVVAKGGPKMTPDDGSGPGQKPRSTGINTRTGAADGIQCPMSLLVGAVATEPEVGHLVLDRTGLKGNYDFKLRWSPQPESGNDPVLTTALQEQLGLKLQWTKAPVEVLVVDQAEKPSAN